MTPIILRHTAMAAPFEVIVPPTFEQAARAAAAEAFPAVDQLEERMSRFVPSSDVSRINALSAGTAVRVSPEVFDCLAISREVWDTTSGAFDITVGPLLELSGNAKGGGGEGTDEQLAAVRGRVGMNLLELDAERMEVTVNQDGVQVDLGGIGKGYAVDAMVAILREYEVEDALVSAGGSTIYAIGKAPGRQGWPVGAGGYRRTVSPRPILLHNRALSGSGGQVRGRHIIDPRTGRPAQGNAAAWAACDKASRCDAFSTAFMVMTPQELKTFCHTHPEVSALLLTEHTDKVQSFGLPLLRAEGADR